MDIKNKILRPDEVLINLEMNNPVYHLYEMTQLSMYNCMILLEVYKEENI